MDKKMNLSEFANLYYKLKDLKESVKMKYEKQKEKMEESMDMKEKKMEEQMYKKVRAEVLKKAKGKKK